MRDAACEPGAIPMAPVTARPADRLVARLAPLASQPITARLAGRTLAEAAAAMRAELASGRTDALTGDFEDADQRKWIARAVVSAAKSHVAFGLTLKEARHAERLLASTPARGEHDWER